MKPHYGRIMRWFYRAERMLWQKRICILDATPEQNQAWAIAKCQVCKISSLRAHNLPRNYLWVPVIYVFFFHPPQLLNYDIVLHEEVSWKISKLARLEPQRGADSQHFNHKMLHHCNCLSQACSQVQMNQSSRLMNGTAVIHPLCERESTLNHRRSFEVDTGDLFVSPEKLLLPPLWAI